MTTTTKPEDPELTLLDVRDEVAGAVRALRAIEALLIGSAATPEAVQPNDLAALLDIVIQRLDALNPVIHAPPRRGMSLGSVDLIATAGT